MKWIWTWYLMRRVCGGIDSHSPSLTYRFQKVHNFSLLIIQLLTDLTLLLPRSEDLRILGVEYFSHSPMLSLYWINAFFSRFLLPKLIHKILQIINNEHGCRAMLDAYYCQFPSGTVFLLSHNLSRLIKMSF